jgi:hypothetical protein
MRRTYTQGRGIEQREYTFNWSIKLEIFIQIGIMHDLFRLLHWVR